MAIQLKNAMNRKEMEECTFSPRIDVSHTSKKLREKVGDRSGTSQTRAQEMFVAKKEQWLEQQRREQEARDRSMQKNFISKGSERIMREKSRTMDKGENSFLQRNFYTNRDKSNTSNIDRRRDRSDNQRARDLSATNDFLRDISGTRVSFLNSSQTSQYGKNYYGSNGEKLFKPQINEKSRIMSPRDRETTFMMLHQQAVNQQRKHQIKSFQADKNAQKVANQAVTDNVNSKSDQQLIKQFYSEFSLAI